MQTQDTPRLLRPLPFAALLTLALMAWPLVAGFRVANDDIAFVRAAYQEGTLAEAVSYAWFESPSFRPLEVLVGHFADPVGLTAWPALPIQAAGLLCFLLGLARLCAICLPGLPRAYLPALLFAACTAPTTCSVWQMDTCSQTWIAALGAWSTIACWHAVERAREGRVAWRETAFLALAFLVGVNVKESFYGWSLGLGVMLAVAAALLARGGLRRGAVLLAPLAPVILVGVVHIAIRFATTSLGERFADAAPGEEGRYQAVFGMNIVLNALVSLGAGFGPGPTHLIADEDASLALRLASVASAAACAFMALVVAGFSVLSSRLPRGVAFGAFGFVAAAAAMSISATLPMRTASELYVLGPNIVPAMLFGACLCLLWNPGSRDERAMARGLALLCTTIVATAGLYGLWSRAEHFRIVWRS
ncbi:MAG: hypothetical protein RL562_2098, partial [Planctomycetota bacterium]